MLPCRRLFIGLMVVLLPACVPAATNRPPSLTSASLYIPRLPKQTPPTDPFVVRFDEGAAPPTGCFALSRRTGAVACVLGHYRIRTDWGERHLSVLSNGDESLPDVAVLVQHTDAGLKLEPQSQRMLDTVMRAGDYITIPAPVTLPHDTPRTFGRLTIELRREEINMTPISAWELKVLVRREPLGADAESDEGATDVLLANTMTATVACVDPSLSIRMLEPTIVLIERECRFDDDGDTEVTLSAWLCDSDRSRCD